MFLAMKFSSHWRAALSILAYIFSVALGGDPNNPDDDAYYDGWWTPRRLQISNTFDKAEVPLIESAFKDVIQMVKTTYNFRDHPHAPENSNFDFDKIFRKYFPIEDKDNVFKVLDRFRAKEPNGEYTMYSPFIRPARENDPHLDVANAFAYVWVSYDDNVVVENDVSLMYFVQDGEGQQDFALLPFLSDKRCPLESPWGPLEAAVDEMDTKDVPTDPGRDQLDPWVSNQMYTFGSIAAHEAFHCWEMWLGQLPKTPASPGAIVDVRLDGETIYGPQGVRKLAAQKPSQAKYSADNYAWWLSETYWTIRCQMEFQDPKDNANSPVRRRVVCDMED